MTEAMGPPDTPAFRSTSAIAIAPKRRGPAAALKRPLRYLIPIAVVVLAITSLVATVGIPIMLPIAVTTLGVAAFIMMTPSLVWRVASRSLQLTKEAATASIRIAETFDAPRDIADGPSPEPARAGRLELDDVGFRVPDPVAGDEWLLRHVTLVVEAGETLALVGAAGTGKSLLTALLSRIYDPSEGRILLDGQDIREMSLPSLRRAVGTAFEDPTMFSMSVAENLRMGRPDATDAELFAAIDSAAAGFVHDLPFGIDTRIGEQGIRLSGGQRQRLCLARAIVATPKLLVVDDALSRHDAHTETEITAALRVALKDVTGIVVARRISTVLLADRVALLEEAESGPTITHVGKHAELFAQVPRYRQLLMVHHGLGNDVIDVRQLPSHGRYAQVPHGNPMPR